MRTISQISIIVVGKFLLDKGKGGKGAKTISPILDGPTESDTSRPLDSEEIQALAIRLEELDKVKREEASPSTKKFSSLVTCGKTSNRRRICTEIFHRQENKNWSAKTPVSLRNRIHFSSNY